VKGGGVDGWMGGWVDGWMGGCAELGILLHQIGVPERLTSVPGMEIAFVHLFALGAPSWMLAGEYIDNREIDQQRTPAHHCDPDV
jgi:hypothetical protein